MKTEDKNEPSEQPKPEVLHPKADTNSTDSEVKANPGASKIPAHARHALYRPSHKATFIGLGVVVLIMAANIGVIVFLMKSNNEQQTDLTKGEVTLSSGVLDSLGVSRNSVGSSGTQLTINPNTIFGGNISVGSDVNIAGQLKLNSKLSATSASLTKLEAGETSISNLNVSGDGTLSNLNLRKDLIVVGSTKLQGAVTIGQLLTVYNNVNVSGSLSVGGTLSMGAFQTNTLVVGGHITTRGSAPAVSSGSAVGANGTVSISGNDVAGTVAVNFGTSGGNGIVAYVTFVTPFQTTPKIVITAVGHITGSYYIGGRTSTGFSIGVNGAVAPGGYGFDYIVMQ